MIKRIENAQLRHRIYQASFKGIQRAIEKKAKEHGISVVYVDPKSASKLCLVHSAPILYDNSTRIVRCSVGGELWQRDVVACWNILSRALWGDGSSASSPAGLDIDEPRMPFGANATHEPTEIPKSL
jgi:transposase